jgi:hypothetical protein
MFIQNGLTVGSFGTNMEQTRLSLNQRHIHPQLDITYWSSSYLFMQGRIKDGYIYISSFIWLVMFISRIEMSECSWSLAASPARFLIKGQRPRAVWENGGTGPGDWDTVYKQRPIGCLTQKKILINRSKSMWCISIIHHHSISGFLGRTR